MKFQIKTTLWMIGIATSLFGIGGSVLMQQSIRQSLRQEEEDLYGVYQMTAGMLGAVGKINGRLVYEDVADCLDIISDGTELWDAVTLTAHNRVIYQTYGKETEAVFEGEYEKTSLEEGICELKYRKTEEKYMLMLTGVVLTKQEPVRFNMSRDVSELFEQRALWLRIYHWVFLLLMVLCAAAVYSISRILTEPLRSLAEAAKQIADGNLQGRVNVCSDDEIGQVGKEFNRMAVNLEQMMTQMKEQISMQEQFTGNFSHELKTPMTSIIGYADLIRRGCLDEEEISDAAEYIVSEGKRLENLSMKLLELLTVKRGKICFVMASPNEIISILATPLKQLYKEKNVNIDFRTEKGTCRMDPDLFSSLILNLTDNAYKAVKGAGFIRVTQKMTVDGCIVFVRDNGRGIPEDSLSHLTEAFYRVDRSRTRDIGGTGLGLSICGEIVRVHGGYLRFRSAKGKGTVVMAVLKGGRDGK